MVEIENRLTEMAAELEKITADFPEMINTAEAYNDTRTVTELLDIMNSVVAARINIEQSLAAKILGF